MQHSPTKMHSKKMRPAPTGMCLWSCPQVAQSRARQIAVRVLWEQLDVVVLIADECAPLWAVIGRLLGQCQIIL
ncbi:MAG: hypothetical protein EBT98_06155 [Opitutaceae bacterium]|nr:hypothetical protein [Opitutaceae bacterium]NBR58018.1 hypothetical protein [Opitutaceae bacterium]